MNKPYTLLAAATLLLVAACTDQPTSPQADVTASAASSGAAHVTVMTRNMFVGFDADGVLAALASGDPNQIGPAMQQAVATLQRTDVLTRARAIAAEIDRARPHAVGVQEAYHIQADLSAFGIPTAIDMDYLQVLQFALAERNLPYVVAGKVLDTDASPFPGVHLIDWDVLLIDESRVTLTGPVMAQTFQTNIGVLAPGIDKKAGYIVAPASVNGFPVTFVSTHLESDVGPASYPLVTQLRAAQATEIATVLGTAAPAIVMGDMNDHAGSLFYQVLGGAGFEDVWTALRPEQEGLTCCFAPDLSDPSPSFDERIDFVFTRGFAHPMGGLQGRVDLVGLRPWELLSGPSGTIWPSDHAGIVADLVVAPAIGSR